MDLAFFGFDGSISVIDTADTIVIVGAFDCAVHGQSASGRRLIFHEISTVIGIVARIY